MSYINQTANSFVLKFVITSSTILTTARNISDIVVGDDLVVTSARVQTDGTGLAGGTNFRLRTNQSVGLSTILEETVANLGANKFVDTSTASVAKHLIVIPAGSNIQVQSTGANCTGSGKIYVYLTLDRLIPEAGVNVA